MNHITRSDVSFVVVAAVPPSASHHRLCARWGPFSKQISPQTCGCQLTYPDVHTRGSLRMMHNAANFRGARDRATLTRVRLRCAHRGMIHTCWLLPRSTFSFHCVLPGHWPCALGSQRGRSSHLYTYSAILLCCTFFDTRITACSSDVSGSDIFRDTSLLGMQYMDCRGLNCSTSQQPFDIVRLELCP